jgi:protocatechuate 3,4-dioxygenase alpha subunit
MSSTTQSQSTPASPTPADATPALATPSQTVGPFYRFGLDWFEPRDLVAPGTPAAVTLSGRIIDGAGEVVPDAVIEIWQADADGGFSGGSAGWGRCLTDDDGSWTFTTYKPGRVDEHQAPHIDVTLFSRGILQRLVTRIYFPGEPTNDNDPMLQAAGDRASTLVARPNGEGRLAHDFVLQGDNETVFFVW